MGGKKEIYRDVRFFHGAVQLNCTKLQQIQLLNFVQLK